jgi:hypothetical protein
MESQDLPLFFHPIFGLRILGAISLGPNTISDISVEAGSKM